MGFADGIALVGTPTLTRGCTPQTGRATAMGVNTLGTGASALLISFSPPGCSPTPPTGG